MKLDSVRLDVHPAANAQGNRVATEETPVSRVMTTRMPLSLSVPLDPNNLPKSLPETTGVAGTIPGEIVKNETLGEVAADARDRCRYCRHFSNDDWKKLLREYRHEATSPDSKPSKRRQAEAFLAQVHEAVATRTTEGRKIVTSGEVGRASADAMLAVPGVCRFWSQQRRGYRTEMKVTLPEQTCENFSAGSREAKRLAVAGYDELMKTGEEVAKKVAGK